MSHVFDPLPRHWAPHSAQSLLLLGMFTFIWVFVLAILVAQSALRAVTRPETPQAMRAASTVTHRQLPTKSPLPAGATATGGVPGRPSAGAPATQELLPEQARALPSSVTPPTAVKTAGLRALPAKIDDSGHSPTTPPRAAESADAAQPKADRHGSTVAAIQRNTEVSRPSPPVAEAPASPRADPLPERSEPTPPRADTPSDRAPAPKPSTSPASADIF